MLICFVPYPNVHHRFIFIGSLETAKFPEQLKLLGITHIINLMRPEEALPDVYVYRAMLSSS